MGARRGLGHARAARCGTPHAHHTRCHCCHCRQAAHFVNRVAALCEAGGVRRLAGRGAGVRARTRPHGAPARAVPPSARRRRRHRGRTQDGVRRVSAAAGGEALELLRRRRRTSLRTCHAHCDERSGFHVRDHVGGRDACAERGVRARRPARLPVHRQPPARHVDVGSVRVGGLRWWRGRWRVRRAAGAALPGRARAGARRARAHEPAQQPRGPEDSEGPRAARVQVPRRVGLVRRAHVLARAAALPRRRRRAARALSARQACRAQRAAPRAPRAPPAACPAASGACAETEAEPGRGASTAQIGPSVPDTVAVVLRARRRRRLLRHALPDLQQDLPRRRRLRVAVLRARLQHGAARAGEQVPLPLPLVLPGVVRHVRGAHRDARLQLSPHADTLDKRRCRLHWCGPVADRMCLSLGTLI